MISFLLNLSKKRRLKREFKIVKAMVEYLFEEVQQGNATSADIPFWLNCIEKLEVLSANGIKGANNFLDLTKELYTKYFDKKDREDKEKKK